VSRPAFYDAFGLANMYSPSLLVVLNPELEPLAEQSYSPLTQLASLRPQRVPLGQSLWPQPVGEVREVNTMEKPIAAGTSYNAATNSIANNYNPIRVTYSQPNTSSSENLVSIMPDPDTLMRLQNIQQAMSKQAPLISDKQNYVSPFGLANYNSFKDQLEQLRKNFASQLQEAQQAIKNQLTNHVISNNPPLQITSINNGIMNARMLIPTGSQLMQVLGAKQLLGLLNQINPARFPASFIEFGNRKQLFEKINNLNFEDIIAIMSRLNVMQRFEVFTAMGLPLDEAWQLATTNNPFLYPFENFASIKKKVRA
ncbi:MAG: hypothetical protein ACP5HW_03680, partial [Candidatus Micrarchaeia archaeon]